MIETGEGMVRGWMEGWMGGRWKGGQTCFDAVEGGGHQVVDLLVLVAGGSAA